MSITYQIMQEIEFDQKRLTDELLKLRKENINLMDTIIAMSCAAIGKPIFTLETGTSEDIDQLQEALKQQYGGKFSEIISALYKDAQAWRDYHKCLNAGFKNG